MIGQGADQSLHLLVRHQVDLHPPRPLQSRGKEVNLADAPVEEGHVDLSEVVLRKLPGQPLEAHLDLDIPGPFLGNQAVQRALAAVIALESDPTENLQRHQPRLISEDLSHALPVGLGLTGPADLAPLTLGCIVDISHGILLDDPPNAADRDSGKLGHLLLGMSCLQQHLDLVSLQQPNQENLHNDALSNGS